MTIRAAQKRFLMPDEGYSYVHYPMFSSIFAYVYIFIPWQVEQ